MHDSKRHRIRTAYDAVTTDHICRVVTGRGLCASDMLITVADIVPEATPQEILAVINGN